MSTEEEIKYPRPDFWCDHFLEKTTMIKKFKLFSPNEYSSRMTEIEIPALKCLKCGGYGRSR